MRNGYAWCLVSLFSLSCGDGGGAEGGTLGELTSSEVKALCEELRPYSLRTWSVACTLEALHMDSSGGASCKRERAACIADSVGDCATSGASSADDMGCKGARVADVRECLKAGAMLSEQEYGAREVDCSTGVHATRERNAGVPTSCERVEESCSDMW